MRPRPGSRPVVVVAAALAAACGGEGDVEQPAPLYGDVPIRYPLELWDQDIEGETLLRVRVDETGRVDSAVVLESSGHPAFDTAAIHGAREMRFSPARKGGERIPVWAKVPVRFSKKPRPDPPPPRRPPPDTSGNGGGSGGGAPGSDASGR